MIRKKNKIAGNAARTRTLCTSLLTLLIFAFCLGAGSLLQTAAAEDLGKYSWTGKWETNWGDMILTQDGAKVSGAYTYDSGRIDGTVSGSILTGTWSEEPSYAPPDDAGEVEFVMSADGKSFTGKWRYGSEGSWGSWQGGTRKTEVILPTPKDYANASSWATASLDQASALGLIPACLKGADLTRPITRAEFATVLVKLYEKTSGKTAAPAAVNPFTDTVDPEVLKAYQVGITSGIAADKFGPDIILNREQCAAMLFRVIKAIHPGGDYSIAGVPDFPDQKDISSFAVEGAKFMSKLGIIKGDDQGCFMPKAITSAQAAAGYGTATREAALLMSVRTFEKMDAIKAASGNNASLDITSSIIGTWAFGTLSGGKFNAASGKYEGGASGLGQTYTFKPDGTYAVLSVWSNVIFAAGKYSVKDGVLTLTDRVAEESNDDGKTWGTKETLPDASAYLMAATDESGKYLLLGEEGGTLPLVDKKNAFIYRFKE